MPLHGGTRLNGAGIDKAGARVVRLHPAPRGGSRRPGAATTIVSSSGRPSAPAQVTFERRELDALLRIYGFMVAEGEWRDYALDFLGDRAVFSVYRRSSEAPLFRVEKVPKLARRQGMWAVLSQSGQVLKRGHELANVLRLLERRLKVVD